jgi:sulfocyanin
MRNHTRTPVSALLLAGTITALVAACGREDVDTGLPETPAEEPQATAAPGQPADLPSWYRMNGNQVGLDIVAGATPDIQYWNFNGAGNGNMTITVPEGAQVTINFRNDDPNMPHSIGVAPFTPTPPANPAPEPVFPGAISQNPVSMTDATLTGETETITFTASQAGQYALLCYIPGHAVSGMWVRFNVGGEPGVTGAPNVQIRMN